MNQGADEYAWMVRPMQVEDIAGVAALSAEEPAAPHWPVTEYHRMLTVIADAPSWRGAWILVPNLAIALADPTATGLQGFAMASHVTGICELEAVVVRSAWRGRRLGGGLVEAVAAWGRELGASRLELEVRSSNAPGRRLYDRMGFLVDGTRPGYYLNPEEDAVLMSLSLEPREVHTA